jgi:hypothetical protein
MARASSVGAVLMACGSTVIGAALARAQSADDVNGLKVLPYNIHANANSDLTITDTAGQPPNPPTPVSLPLSGGAIIDERNYSPLALNRHDLQLSSDGGATAAIFDFQHESIDISMDVTLTAGTNAPRKEAGFVFSAPQGAGQFIVNTDAHEIVAFGNPLVFHRFDTPTYQYQSGDLINLRLIYNAPPRDMGGTIIGDGTVEYRVRLNGGEEKTSGPLTITNLESGFFTGTRVAAYAQGTPANANDFMTARFENFVVDVPAAAEDADFDEDGDVDGQDFLVWQRGVGSSGVGLSMGDANGDMNVDGQDLEIWKTQFGSAGGPVLAVPEPASMVLLSGIALLCVTTRPRRNRS